MTFSFFFELDFEKVEISKNDNLKKNVSIKRMAGMIAVKKGENYSQVINFVRTRLRFALLRSVLIAVRGSRGKVIREPHVGKVAFNLIPSWNPYDC